MWPADGWLGKQVGRVTCVIMYYIFRSAVLKLTLCADAGWYGNFNWVFVLWLLWPYVKIGDIHRDMNYNQFMDASVFIGWIMDIWVLKNIDAKCPKISDNFCWYYTFLLIANYKGQTYKWEANKLRCVAKRKKQRSDSLPPHPVQLHKFSGWNNKHYKQLCAINLCQHSSIGT